MYPPQPSSPHNNNPQLPPNAPSTPTPTLKTLMAFESLIDVVEQFSFDDTADASYNEQLAKDIDSMLNGSEIGKKAFATLIAGINNEKLSSTLREDLCRRRDEYFRFNGVNLFITRNHSSPSSIVKAIGYTWGEDTKGDTFFEDFKAAMEIGQQRISEQCEDDPALKKQTIINFNNRVGNQLVSVLSIELQASYYQLVNSHSNNVDKAAVHNWCETALTQITTQARAAKASREAEAARKEEVVRTAKALVKHNAKSVDETVGLIDATVFHSENL